MVKRRTCAGVRRPLLPSLVSPSSNSDNPRVPTPLPLLRQRLTSRFRRERQYEQSHNKNGAHHQTGRAKALNDVAAGQPAKIIAQKPLNEGAGCGDKTGAVVAKRNAGAAQPSG